MKTVLIWGFYEHGNIGDDLMGMMLYEMIEEMGATPVIFSSKPRFAEMGYRTVSSFRDIQPDMVLLGGGAFFKAANASNPAIERTVADLGTYVNDAALPVHGISLGSDGIDALDQMSPARKRIVLGGNFKSVVLRLTSDLPLGLPGATHAQDIVLLSKTCSDRYKRLTPIQPPARPPATLINLSRRKIAQLPQVLWASRGTSRAVFFAHTGENRAGGELRIPGLTVVDDPRITAQLGYLQAAETIVSSKLHPGVIALSYGNRFTAISPRPKTAAFLSSIDLPSLDIESLWADYSRHLGALLS